MNDNVRKHGKKVAGVAAAIGAAVGIYFAATGPTKWNGDASTGNLKQYSINQQTSTIGPSVVGNAATIVVQTVAGIPAGYKNLIDFKTLKNCTGGNGGRCRAELGVSAATTGSKNVGSHFDLDWYVRFPKAGNGCVPGYWTARQMWGGGPSLSIVNKNGVTTMEWKLFSGSLTNPGSDPNTGLKKTLVQDIPVVFDHWYHIQEVIKWGTTMSTGQYGLTIDGTQIVPLRNTQTRPPNNTPYMKTGNYTKAGCDTEMQIAGLHQT